MVPVEAWPVTVAAFYKKWCQFKLENAYVDFTDLIESALRTVDALPGCRVLFCDEAQDMSKLEFALVRKWGARCDEFIIVGDPDQNLYEWRGSDPDAFYATEAASERILEQSYRVPKAVHKTAVTWVSQITDRKEATYHATASDGAVERRNHIYKNPDGLIDELVGRTADGSTAMVLASCTYMVAPLAARMRELGIPFHNPYRTGFHPWNPLRSAHRLLAFLRPDASVWGSEARMWTWGDVDDWSSVLQADKCFVRGFKNSVKSYQGIDRFGESDADSIAPLPKIMAGMKDDSVREAVMDMDFEWWATNLLHTNRKQAQFALTVARRHGGARLLEPPRIIVGTIHSVKGGEADHVYLFPDLSGAGYYGSWKVPGRNRNSVVRQFYVGMTRAEKTLTLLEPSSEMAVSWLAD
jgi:DNA helicase-2/ATP-dependent DNA helicase PcrA